jgi:hypothetical protein
MATDDELPPTVTAVQFQGRARVDVRLAGPRLHLDGVIREAGLDRAGRRLDFLLDALQAIIDAELVFALHFLQVREQLAFIEQKPIANRAEQFAQAGAGPVEPDARLALEERRHGFDGAELVRLVAVELELHAGVFCSNRSKSVASITPC